MFQKSLVLQRLTWGRRRSELPRKVWPSTWLACVWSWWSRTAAERPRTPSYRGLTANTSSHCNTSRNVFRTTPRDLTKLASYHWPKCSVDRQSSPMTVDLLRVCSLCVIVIRSFALQGCNKTTWHSWLDVLIHHWVQSRSNFQPFTWQYNSAELYLISRRLTF